LVGVLIEFLSKTSTNFVSSFNGRQPKLPQQEVGETAEGVSVGKKYFEMKKLIILSILLAGGFIFASSFSLTTNGVYSTPVWYEHPDYKGQSGTFGCCTANLHKFGWGDCISSIRVPEDWKVVFYQHKGYSGATFTITSDVSDFRDWDWNDAASSVIVYYNGIVQSDCIWKDPNADRCPRCRGGKTVPCCMGEGEKTCPDCKGTGKN
jgi:hypothetical protein